MKSILTRGRGCLAVAMLVLAGAAYANPITIFNTGVDGSGTPLIDGASETHYTLHVVPGGSPSVWVATSTGGFPISAGAWLGDDALSAWIGPNNGGTGATRLDGPVGDYTYRTTFDLTGLDPTTASITGQWLTDNAGLDIQVNGNPTGNTIPYGPYTYATWTPFTISGGFTSGINTLDFIVNNLAPGPTGLRVEITSATADEQQAPPPPVPEPATLLLLGAGLVAVGIFRRRRA